jgi:TP901 family phage tail tape measure protein
MADVFLGSVYANLELRNVQAFKSQLDSASGSGAAFGTSMAGSLVAVGLLSQGLRASIGALTTFVSDGVKSAADLQSGMGLLQAVTGATAAQMDAFNKKAIDLGNDLTLPATNATDAANAMIELGKAGLGVNDVLAASKGVLQAAAAGNLDVASAAKIVSGALLTFNLGGDQASAVADKLAAAANASSLELGDVGFALSQAGAQAQIAGLSLTDTVSIIAEMANKGISAQSAGTSLSYMLKSLLAPTDAGAGALKQLGINVYDAGGKFVGITDIIKQFQTKTAGLTQEQKAQAESTIFGAEALKAANVVFSDGVEGLDKMRAAVDKTGAAQDLAKARQVGFNGAMAGLSNTIDTAALQLGQVFLPVLTTLANFISKNFTLLLPVAAAAVGLFAFAFVGALPGIGAFAAAMWAAVAPILPFVLAGTAIAVALVFLQEKFDIFGKALAIGKTLWEDLTRAVQPLVPVFQAVANFVGGQFASIFASLKLIFEDIKRALTPVIDAMVDFYQKHAAAFQTAFKIIGIVVAAITFAPLVIAIGIVIGAITILAKILEFVADHFVAIAKVVGVVIAIAFLPLTIAIAAVIGIVLLVIEVVKHWGDIMSFLGGVIGAVMGFIGGIFSAIGGAIMAVVNAIGSVVSTVFNAIAAVIGAVFNVIAGIWNTVLKPVFDAIAFVITALFTIVSTIFTGIAQVIFIVVSTIVQIIGVILYGIVLFIYNNILLPIWNFFVTVWNAIYAAVSAVVTAVVDFVIGYFNFWYNTISAILSAIWGFIVGVWNAIYGFLAPIVSAIIDFVIGRWNNLVANISAALSLAWSIIVGVWNSIYGFISGIVSSIWNAVSSGFTNVKNAISDGINAGLNIVKNIVGDFLSAGKNIIDGIVKGISGGKDAVVNKIKDICKGALDAVKSFFGIHSPSKVMQKMFGFVMQGAEIGVSKNAGSLLDTFNSATNLLPSLGSSPLSGSFAASAAGGMAAVRGGVINNTTGGAVSIDTVNINSRQDDSRFLNIIGRNAELAQNGIVGANS